jgi:multicomponent K+:H+ antiporter subunit A
LTKSAQFPFHFWLPHAMAAPTPVSAYLHSATMVKAGVFLLARLWPVLAGTDMWFWIVGGAGLITLLLGAYAAMFQNDLKSLLAYSTISHLGLITLLLGLNSPLAAVAAVFHTMNHATFKASLFMSVGIIDHETGSRDMRRLDGLYRFMPITGTLAIVACAAMAGVPLLNGFLSKEMFFAETVFLTANPWVEAGLPIAATIAGVFAVVYSLRFGHDVFFGPPPKDLPRQPHEPVRWMRVPVDLLVLACVVVGTVPAWSIGPVLATAARPVVGGALPDYSLAVWHGVNSPLLMSLVADGRAASPSTSQFGSRFKQRGSKQAPAAAPLDGKRLFERTLALATAAARQRAAARRDRAGCSRSCSGCCLRRRLGARLGADRAAGLGRSGTGAGDARIRSSLGARRGRCNRRRDPGQVPSPRRASRCCPSSACAVCLTVRVVLGARPRTHPARRSRSSPSCCSCSGCAGCRDASNRTIL